MFCFFGYLSSGWWWLFVPLWFLLMFLFVKNGIKVIPSVPPHKAILTVFGKRYNVLIDEGWRWFPLHNIVFAGWMVDVTKINKDANIRTVRTPDGAELEVQVSVTFTPGRWDNSSDAEKAKALITYLNNGGYDVWNIIEDILDDAIRTWAFSKDEGPQSWEEAVAAGDDAKALIVKAVLGSSLPPVNSDIPTRTLLRYFHEPRLKPLKVDSERWGENWEKLEKRLKRLTPKEIETLKAQIKTRQDIIDKITRGNGNIFVESLGITINKLTLNSIRPIGKTAEAIDKIASELQEREAEKIEIAAAINRINDLMKNTGCSLDQAIQLFQVERKKVSKSVNEFVLPPEIIKFIYELFKK
jgi:hypothetical protein